MRGGGEEHLGHVPGGGDDGAGGSAVEKGRKGAWVGKARFFLPTIPEPFADLKLDPPSITLPVTHRL